MLIRFYCENIDQPLTELSEDQSHHLMDVRRLRVGEQIELFDGLGTLAAATVQLAAKRKVILKVTDLNKFPRPQRPQIVIAASIPKGYRFEWLLAKCTELGIDRIVPIIFSRTIKQPSNPKIMDRWENIAIESAKQCGRLFLPQIDIPYDLTEALEIFNKDYKDMKLLYGSPQPSTASLIDTDLGKSHVVALIGPEGGFSDDEQAQLDLAGAIMVRLTDTILRVETAAIAFASVLSTYRSKNPLE